jgi:histidinol phosphatase-like PHP family hydrolase
VASRGGKAPRPIPATPTTGEGAGDAPAGDARARGRRLARTRKTRRGSSRPAVLRNAQIAELLALEADRLEGHAARACRRASRLAFLWPEEAAALHARGDSLTLLSGIGPFLARRLREWIEDPSPVPDPPDLRRGFMTLTEARALLAAHPAWEAELRGDLQMHTEWSDGSASVAEMAAAALERGYEYIAVTDHSKGLKIAGGLDEAELLAQADEITRVNEELAERLAGLTVLSSLEMNLSPTGEGDMDPAALARLDLVLGSFHSSLRKSEDQTARYLAAVSNPHVQVLGHPRGRVYNFRVGLGADWRRVFAAAAELDKAVEVDAFPDRQDLDVDLLRLARAEGVRVSVGTDAHHPWQLGFVELGLATAIQAGVPRERVLNFLPLAELVAWVEVVREKTRGRKVG